MGDLGSIAGLGRSPGEEKGYPFQPSCLENSMDCSWWGHIVGHNWATFQIFGKSRFLDLISLDQEQNPYCGDRRPCCVFCLLSSIDSHLLKPAFPVQLQEAPGRLLATPTTNHWSQIHTSHLCLHLSQLCDDLSFHEDSVQLLSHVQPCKPMECSRPDLVHHQLPELTQTSVHRVGNAIQPSHLNHVVPFCLQSFPASGYFFPIRWLQVLEFPASASVLPVNIQDWSPLGWTGLISLQSKGLSKDLSNTTVQKHQFFGAQLSLVQLSHPYITGKTIALTRQTPLLQSNVCFLICCLGWS